MSNSAKRRSPVWKYFESTFVTSTTEDGKEVRKVQCKLCDTQLTYKGSTTNMINHVQGKHSMLTASSSSSQSKTQTTLSLVSKTCSPSRAKEIDKLVADFVAEDLRPIATVDGSGFKRLLNFLEPSYSVPSRTHIMSLLRKKHVSLKQELLIEVASHNLALTTDIWTSRATEAYITITAHYIDDDWNLVSKVLCTEGMPERHTGVNIAERIRAAMRSWQVKDEAISGIVHDNAANMMTAMDELDLNHMSCFAHTLQLAVNKGLDNALISRVSAVARKLVGHFKHSAAATQELKLKQEQLGIPQHHLIQDVSTRWNSTFFMFQRLLEQRWAIFAVLVNEQSTQYQYRHLFPKEDQWELLSQMATVLEPLQIATTALCESEIVSCSLIFPVINGLLNNHLNEKDDDVRVVKTFKSVVREQIEERFNIRSSDILDTIPVLAAALDPRYHQLRFFSSSQRARVIENIKQKLTLAESEEECQQTEESETPPQQKKTALSFLIGEDSSEDSPEVEIERFMSLPALKQDQNTLLWWKRNAEEYPHLSKLAKTFLCIPATSVPAERVFSSAGLIVSSLRSSLSADNVDMLIFMNKNR